MSTPRQYAAALAGHTPAEALDGGAKDRLVRTLVRRGWSDVHIAEHTRWSTYTVGRIRERLGLAANREEAG